MASYPSFDPGGFAKGLENRIHNPAAGKSGDASVKAGGGAAPTKAGSSGKK